MQKRWRGSHTKKNRESSWETKKFVKPRPPDLTLRKILSPRIVFQSHNHMSFAKTWCIFWTFDWEEWRICILYDILVTRNILQTLGVAKPDKSWRLQHLEEVSFSYFDIFIFTGSSHDSEEESWGKCRAPGSKESPRNHPVDDPNFHAWTRKLFSRLTVAPEASQKSLVHSITWQTLDKSEQNTETLSVYANTFTSAECNENLSMQSLRKMLKHNGFKHKENKRGDRGLPWRTDGRTGIFSDNSLLMTSRVVQFLYAIWTTWKTALLNPTWGKSSNRTSWRTRSKAFSKSSWITATLSISSCFYATIEHATWYMSVGLDGTTSNSTRLVITYDVSYYRRNSAG